MGGSISDNAPEERKCALGVHVHRTKAETDHVGEKRTRNCTHERKRRGERAAREAEKTADVRSRNAGVSKHRGVIFLIRSYDFVFIHTHTYICLN